MDKWTSDQIVRLLQSIINVALIWCTLAFLCIVAFLLGSAIGTIIGAVALVAYVLYVIIN